VPGAIVRTIGLVFTLLVLAGCGGGGGGVLDGPTEHDFGAIPIDTPTTHHIELTSRADEVLFLRNVTRSCKCATVAVTPEKIAPGATVDIAVTMTVDDTSGNQARIGLIFETSDGEVARDLVVTARGAP
jgi:hypothetical protein